jgi:hypothetical protein
MIDYKWLVFVMHRNNELCSMNVFDRRISQNGNTWLELVVKCSSGNLFFIFCLLILFAAYDGGI